MRGKVMELSQKRGLVAVEAEDFTWTVLELSSPEQHLHVGDVLTGPLNQHGRHELTNETRGTTVTAGVLSHGASGRAMNMLMSRGMD